MLRNINIFYDLCGFLKCLHYNIMYKLHTCAILLPNLSTLSFYRLDGVSYGDLTVFSKRQRITLRLLYAIAIPSVVCLSVVCCL